MNIDLKKPLVYVTRDIERALGIEPKGGYFVISNDTPYAREIQKSYPDNVLLIQGDGMLDTYDLLALPQTHEALARHSADVVVFQNTKRIERLAQEKGWNLINPSAELALKVEEKISQISWLKEDVRFLPPHKAMLLKEASYEGKRFVLQFNHSHTGQGTYIIDSKEALETLAAKYPERACRIVDFIDGPVFTINAIVSSEISVGNISYQITGIAPFTDLPFSTIGNDWELPLAPHYKNVFEDSNKMAASIGERLFDQGWRGLFGLDVIFDEKTKKVYLLEINARQPASAVFESVLQKRADPKGWSVFEAHIAALLRFPLKNLEITAIESGSQIVKRATKKKYAVDFEPLRGKGLTVLEYETNLHNKELYRIQSASGVMEGHNLLNSLGLAISSCFREL